MNDLRRRVRDLVSDPFASTLVATTLLGVAGVVAIVLGAIGAADAATLDAQLPFVVSGGLGGLALVIVAAGLYSIQRRRFAAARRRIQLDRVLHAAVALGEARSK